MKYRPYFAYGRHQLRVGWTWLGDDRPFPVRRYHFIALEWQ